MTILITADLHLNNLPRDQYRHNFQKELCALVKEHGVHTCLILGDLTDEKDFHSAQLVNKVVDHIHNLAQLATVIIIKGNHDYTDIAQTPFFDFLRRVEGVHWLGVPTPGLSLKNLPPSAATGLRKTLFLPHSPNPARDWPKKLLAGHDLILAHNTFAGALSESGRQMSGPSTEIFPKGTQVISGDVHVPQTVGPVTYVGSPYRIDFGDSFEPRVFIIEGDSIHSITTDATRKQLIEVKAGELTKLGTKKVLEDLAKGDILKIRVELEPHQHANWHELKEQIRSWAYKHEFVPHLIQVVAKRKSMSKKASKQSPRSDAELLKGFADRQSVDKKTLEVGLDFL